MNPCKHIKQVSNFDELVSTRFQGEINAICWSRELKGDFAEIVHSFTFSENMIELDLEELRELKLSEEGHIARKILIKDFELLKDFGAQPTLNIIKYYERDDSYPFFPTDVYSWHVDRSPIPGATFLCTYHGNSSDILANADAEQKILVPEIRAELKKLFQGSEESLEAFLEENFFDLHYQAKANAKAINLGLGHLWRLAVDSPESEVLPCIHRAPMEKNGGKRLLLIC
ncbi:MAG: hypothetical protein ACK5B9_00285 [Flavobacteriia bacterium]|jgi:hypothetical protein